ARVRAISANWRRRGFGRAQGQPWCSRAYFLPERRTRRRLYLQHAGMEAPGGPFAADHLKAFDENVAGGVGGDDGVYPAAGGAIADVGLLFVALVNLGAECFQLRGVVVF